MVKDNGCAVCVNNIKLDTADNEYHTTYMSDDRSSKRVD